MYLTDADDNVARTKENQLKIIKGNEKNQSQNF